MTEERKKHHKPTAKGLANLKPPINKRPTEEQREIRIKGGIRSGEVRRAKKTMREMLDYLLAKEKVNAKRETSTTLEEMSIALCDKAISGSEKAYELIAKITGELTNQVELTGSVQKVYVTKEQELEAEKHIDDMINE